MKKILLLIFGIAAFSNILFAQYKEGKEVLKLVNEARSKKCKCGTENKEATTPLKWNSQLALAALKHAEYISKSGNFSHTGQGGSKPSNRVSKEGYKWSTVGENIAQGQLTPKEVVESWMGSPNHCSNIMNSSFKEVGIVLVKSKKMGYIWVQVFATKM